MSNDLRFYKPLDASHPVNLRFGTTPPVIPTYTIVLNAAIPAPKLTALVIPPNVSRFNASIPAPKLSAVVTYDNAVFRGVAVRSKERWQVADSLKPQRQDFTHPVIKTLTQIKQQWSPAQNADRDAPIPFYEGIRLRRKENSAWGGAIAVRAVRANKFKQLAKKSKNVNENWQRSVRTNAKTLSTWIQLIKLSGARFESWFEARHVEVQQESRAGGAAYLSLQSGSRWQEAVKPRVGRYGVVVLPPILPPCYVPPAGSLANLVFRTEIDGVTSFRFACNHLVPPPKATVVIPIKRAYIVINDISLRRVDGNYILPIDTLNMNIDSGSWTWAFSAQMPASALPYVEPDVSGSPVILEASINGIAYRLLAEKIQRDRSFGRATISISGRGHSAVLTDPYSPIKTFINSQERTAQQLMNDVLTFNGISLGWTIDWRIDDWLVPSEVFSHRGTYMNAVTTIANAGGAFVQPDPVDQILRIRSLVPVKPWEIGLATPDLDLPSAVVLKESVAWSDKPAYNAVYVSGTSNSGILGMVKRTGTAGELLAPMITDPLMTDVIAARQRGLVVLADTGRQSTYSLSLPVLPQTGIIEPGTLVRYIDNQTVLGVVSGVSFVGESGRRTARQTIEVKAYG